MCPCCGTVSESTKVPVTGEPSLVLGVVFKLGKTRKRSNAPVPEIRGPGRPFQHRTPRLTGGSRRLRSKRKPEIPSNSNVRIFTPAASFQEAHLLVSSSHASAILHFPWFWCRL